MLRHLEDGLVIASDGYTVAQAVEDWLTYGLSNRDPATQDVNWRLCEKHVIPLSGVFYPARKAAGRPDLM
jgi:hypothetical protein